MLFGMPVSKYALNNKNLKTLERTTLLLVSFAFINLAWHVRTAITMHEIMASHHH